jgi:hypothetical protein
MRIIMPTEKGQEIGVLLDECYHKISKLEKKMLEKNKNK